VSRVTLALSNPSRLSLPVSGVHLRRAPRAFASESDVVDYEHKLEAGDGKETSLGHPQANLSQRGPLIPALVVHDWKTRTRAIRGWWCL